MIAALQLPGSVAGVIMVDTYTELGNGRSMEQIKAFVDDLGTDFQAKVRDLVHSFYLPDSRSSLVERIANDMSSAPPNVALSAIKSSFLHSRQVTHDLELLAVPMIAINADHWQTNVESIQTTRDRGGYYAWSRTFLDAGRSPKIQYDAGNCHQKIAWTLNAS